MPKTKTQLVAILDNIRSLYNVGSIFRTSDAFAIEHLYLCGITGTPQDQLHKKRISKTSLGAEENLPWSYSNNTLDVVTKLKEQGFTIISLELTPNSIPISQLSDKLTETSQLALIIGHELFGVSEAALNESDIITHIPMQGQKESLNVTVAYGIASFYLKTPNAQGFTK